MLNPNIFIGNNTCHIWISLNIWKEYIESICTDWIGFNQFIDLSLKKSFRLIFILYIDISVYNFKKNP